MPRYIDADKIKYTMLYQEKWLTGTGIEKQGVWKDDIDKMPTADVVEVVRCADCKWFNPINNGDHGYCGTPFNGAEVYEDDYCSDGERRTE